MVIYKWLLGWESLPTISDILEYRKISILMGKSYHVVFCYFIIFLKSYFHISNYIYFKYKQALHSFLNLIFLISWKTPQQCQSPDHRCLSHIDELDDSDLVVCERRVLERDVGYV